MEDNQNGRRPKWNRKMTLPKNKDNHRKANVVKFDFNWVAAQSKI